MPPRGWQSPERKVAQIHIPVTADQIEDVLKTAAFLKTNKTDAARELLQLGISVMKQRGKIP